jgi:hypothetical protein
VAVVLVTLEVVVAVVLFLQRILDLLLEIILLQ